MDRFEIFLNGTYTIGEIGEVVPATVAPGVAFVVTLALIGRFFWKKRQRARERAVQESFRTFKFCYLVWRVHLLLGAAIFSNVLFRLEPIHHALDVALAGFTTAAAAVVSLVYWLGSLLMAYVAGTGIPAFSLVVLPVPHGMVFWLSLLTQAVSALMAVHSAPAAVLPVVVASVVSGFVKNAEWLRLTGLVMFSYNYVTRYLYTSVVQWRSVRSARPSEAARLLQLNRDLKQLVRSSENAVHERLFDESPVLQGVRRRSFGLGMMEGSRLVTSGVAFPLRFDREICLVTAAHVWGHVESSPVALVGTKIVNLIPFVHEVLMFKDGATPKYLDVCVVRVDQSLWPALAVPSLTFGPSVESSRVRCHNDTEFSEGSVIEVRDRAILHCCSTTLGWSGSPVCDTHGDVVAVHAGEVGGVPGNRPNYAIRLDNIIRARLRMPDEKLPISPVLESRRGARVADTSSARASGDGGLERHVVDSVSDKALEQERLYDQYGIIDFSDPRKAINKQRRKEEAIFEASFGLVTYDPPSGASIPKWDAPREVKERKGWKQLLPNIQGYTKAAKRTVETEAQRRVREALDLKLHYPPRDPGSVIKSLEAYASKRLDVALSPSVMIRAQAAAQANLQMEYAGCACGKIGLPASLTDEAWAVLKQHVISTSTPGFPYDAKAVDNAAALRDFEPEIRKQTREYLQDWRNGKVTPIHYRLMVKNEPHPDRKMGNPRIIWIPPLALTMAMDFVLGEMLRWEITQFAKIPTCVGIGAHDDGLRSTWNKIRTKSEGMGACYAVDAQAWDWNCRPEWIDAGAKVREWFYANYGGNVWLSGMYKSLKQNPEFVLSDGRRGQLDFLVHASGLKNTAGDNSVRIAYCGHLVASLLNMYQAGDEEVMSFVRSKGDWGSHISDVLAGEPLIARTMSMGDDLLLWLSKPVDAKLVHVLFEGIGVRLRVLERDKLEFCSHTFSETGVTRDMRDKVLYNLIRYWGTPEWNAQAEVFEYEMRYADVEAHKLVRRAFEVLGKPCDPIQQRSRHGGAYFSTLDEYVIQLDDSLFEMIKAEARAADSFIRRVGDMIYVVAFSRGEVWNLMRCVDQYKRFYANNVVETCRVKVTREAVVRDYDMTPVRARALLGGNKRKYTELRFRRLDFMFGRRF